MRSLSSILLVIFIVLQFACSNTEPNNLPKIEAEATILNIELDSINYLDEQFYEVKETTIGSAKFSQQGNVVTLNIQLENMTPNSLKAVHIHNGEITAPRRHWNQNSYYAFCDKKSLGKSWNKVFAGDIGNVQIGVDGKGSLTIKTDLWALNTGDEKDILQKVVIVHEQGEEFGKLCNPSYPHNHEGNPKIAGGIIQLTSDVIIQKKQIIQTQFPEFTICK